MTIHPSARLIGPLSSGIAAGGAGVATANASTTTPIIGELMGVYIQYNDAPPAGTTDVVLSTVGSEPFPPTVSFLTRTNSATGGWFRPALQLCDGTGAAIAGAYGAVLLADFVNVKIDQANAGDSVSVWLLLRE